MHYFTYVAFIVPNLSLLKYLASVFVSCSVYKIICSSQGVFFFFYKNNHDEGGLHFPMIVIFISSFHTSNGTSERCSFSFKFSPNNELDTKLKVFPLWWKAFQMSKLCFQWRHTIKHNIQFQKKLCINCASKKKGQRIKRQQLTRE